MLGLAYAAPPLYRIFCQATGVGGEIQRAGESKLEVGLLGSFRSLWFKMFSVFLGLLGLLQLVGCWGISGCLGCGLLGLLDVGWRKGGKRGGREEG